MKKDDKAPDYLTIEIKSSGESWGIVHAMPRNFTTGSVGYYGVGKISNPENPQPRKPDEPVSVQHEYHVDRE